MTEKLFAGLVSIFGSKRPSRSSEKEMLIYAKTEYRDDWQYAYQHMLTHDGKGPPGMGVFY